MGSFTSIPLDCLDNSGQAVKQKVRVSMDAGSIENALILIRGLS